MQSSSSYYFSWEGCDLRQAECGMRRLRLHPENHLICRIGWSRAAVLGANDGIIS
jgi:hypothetical protein